MTWVVDNPDFAGSPRLDWLSLTFPASSPVYDDLVSQLCDWFGDSGVRLDRGMMGYSSAMAVLGSGRILFDGSLVSMGVHVFLPHGALSQIPDLESFLLWAFLNGAESSRLDICLDSDSISYDVIRDAVLETDGTTRRVAKFRTIDERVQHLGGSGRTLYLGSPSSDCRVRIYDKAAEQDIDDGSIWLRFEVQFRDDRAHSMFQFLMCDDRALIGDVLRSVLDLREAGSDNVSRLPVLDWWGSWLSAAGVLRLPVPAPDSTIEDIAEWVNRQVAPSLALLFLAAGGDMSFLTDLVRAGRPRIPLRRLALLSSRMASFPPS